MKMNGIDLTKCNNCRFKAKVDGKEKTGRIQIVGNSVKFWFDYHDELNDIICHTIHMSFYRGYGDGDYFNDLEIIPRDPETYRDWQVGDKVTCPDEKWNNIATLEVIFRSGELVALKDLDGCCYDCYTCQELLQKGYRLVLTDIEKQIIEEKKVVEDIPKPYEFKNGEPVLVRSDRTHCWQLRAISLSVYGNPPKVEVTDGCDEWIYWIDKDEVIPYNERTMHLLGTSNDYVEE